MIARTWTARASQAGAEAYATFFSVTLLPELAAIEGHCGAFVLTRALEHDEVLITVTTLWKSMLAVARFAGTDPELAVVEPEALALLNSFDDRVHHHEVRIAQADREG
jgi:hypothetical protein